MFKEVLNNKKYYFLLTVVISLSTILNYNSNLMAGILPYYYDFSNYFSNGLKFTKPFNKNIYTWPMWGYGLILLIGSKLFIIILQQIITLFTIIIIRKYLRNIVYPISFKFISILILFAFPWFYFHVSLWPYSISANFFTLSVLLLGIGYEQRKLGPFIISAVFFGITLNFRSDYYYLVWLLCIFGVLYSLFNYKTDNFKRMLIWITIINIILLPWYFYTKKYTGEGLFTSSNSGHVFFISLGQLPENKWKISTSDGDSIMYSLVRNSFGDNESSLSLKSSRLLMNEFKNRVIADPEEFAKKCFHNAFNVMIFPFYFGDYQKAFSNSKKIEEIKSSMNKH